MSIVDALKKAKALGKERQREEAHASSAAARDLMPVGDETLANEFPEVAAPSIPQPVVRRRVAFPVLQYDALKCSANRILMPDVDPKLANTASPAYRMLRTRLLQRCRASGWSAIAVTSPGPGEGKTTTALNLALTIARERINEVFLLDLDMRNPSLCKYIGVTPQADVTDYFRGEIAAEEIMFTVGVDNLTLAGSLSTTPNASELLASNKLQELIAFIKDTTSNPLILLDLPPVANTDDALVVAPRVDSTILVVAEGRTNRGHLQRALDLLADFTMAGVVLNRAMESLGADYYGS